MHTEFEFGIGSMLVVELVSFRVYFRWILNCLGERKIEVVAYDYSWVRILNPNI